MSDPAITIVAAGVNVRETLVPWLRALAPQVERAHAEVLVAVAGVDAFIADALRPFAWARAVESARAGSIPALWSAAMAQSRGEIVAVSITACQPAPDWVDAVVQAHGKPHAAIGGVIDLAAEATWVDRAVHLVRYAPYMPPATEGPIAEIAADNASYKRAALAPLLPAISRDGFWEVDVHRQLRAHGHALWLDPHMCVHHARSFSIAGFSVQRFRHGRHFARTQPGLSAMQRVLRMARAPLVPVVMLVRLVRTVAGRGRLDGRNALALPLSAWFLLCWAAGEATGYANA